MEKFIQSLVGLLKVKTIVTIVVMAVFAVLSLNGSISADNAMIIISMVVSFYFGTQHEKTTAPTMPNAQSPVAVIATVPETPTSGATSPVDTATYNQTHPDTTA